MKNNEKKKDNKIIMIIAIALGALLLVGLIIFGIIKLLQPAPLPEWGKTYYNYLSNFKNTAKKTLTEHNVEVSDQYTGNMYYTSDKPEEPPVMSIKDPENKYMLIVLIVDGEAKEFYIDLENAKIELLYNIREQNYYYYFMYQENDKTHFIKLTDYVKSLIDPTYKPEELVITNGEKVTVAGQEVLKVDTYFIEPNQAEISFEFKPEEITGLDKELRYFITDVKNNKNEMRNGSKNGVNDKIDEMYTIIVEINKGETETPSPEPSAPPEEPSNPNPEPDPVPDPHQCEYDYLEWIWDGCYDPYQLMKPGGCDMGYYEIDGVCWSFDCWSDPDNLDTTCTDKYDKPGPGECAPGLSLHEGYCFRH